MNLSSSKLDPRNYPIGKDQLEPTRMKDVPMACEELATSISALDEALTQFLSRLRLVSRQEPEAVAEGCPGRASKGWNKCKI